MLNSYESACFPYKTFSVPISKIMNRLTVNPAYFKQCCMHYYSIGPCITCILIYNGGKSIDKLELNYALISRATSHKGNNVMISLASADVKIIGYISIPSLF